MLNLDGTNPSGAFAHQTTADGQFSVRASSVEFTRVGGGTASLTAGGWVTTSDPDKKQNINILEGAEAGAELDKIKAYTFTYKGENKKRNFKGKRKVMSTEIDSLDFVEFDEFEDTDEDIVYAGIMADEFAETKFGMGDGKTANYNDIVGLLLAERHSNKEIIKSLTERVSQLETK